MDYKLVDPETETAILRGDVEKLRGLLPALTGRELDGNGFPLLFLAAIEEQPEIFALLLESGKFNPVDRGLYSAMDFSDPHYQKMGFEEDKLLENEWGLEEHGKRGRLFEKLLDDPRQSVTRTTSPDDAARVQMLRALLRSPHLPPVELDASHVLLLVRDGCLSDALANPAVSLSWKLLVMLQLDQMDYDNDQQVYDTLQSQWEELKQEAQKHHDSLRALIPNATANAVFEALCHHADFGNDNELEELLRQQGHKLSDQQQVEIVHGIVRQSAEFDEDHVMACARAYPAKTVRCLVERRNQEVLRRVLDIVGNNMSVADYQYAFAGAMEPNRPRRREMLKILAECGTVEAVSDFLVRAVEYGHEAGRVDQKTVKILLPRADLTDYLSREFSAGLSCASILRKVKDAGAPLRLALLTEKLPECLRLSERPQNLRDVEEYRGMLKSIARTPFIDSQLTRCEQDLDSRELTLSREHNAPEQPVSELCLSALAQARKRREKK